MCPDKTARGSGITSRVIRSERVHTSRREVLTFPIKASGKDEPTLTATMRCGTRSGERPQSWQEAEAEVRKLQSSLWGTSYHLAAGDEATTAECGSLSLASTVPSFLEPLFGARAFEYCMLYPGLWRTALFPRVLYHAHRWSKYKYSSCVSTSAKMSMSHQNLNWQLVID